MEGIILNMEVHTVSSENIKPSSPTPHHLKCLQLSLLDQLHSSFIVPALLFYPSNTPHTSSPFDISCLKSSLSQTLDSFYPLLGRLESSTTDCNNEGIPFIETKVSCPLSAVNKYSCSPYRVDVLGKFYPPKGLLLGETGARLAIQINVFACGGVVLGLYFSHKFMDGTSASTFLRHWAAISSRRDDCLAQVQPEFDVASIDFPPIPEVELSRRRSALKSKEHDTEKNGKEVEPIVIRSFIFRSSAVGDLKAKAASKEVPNPSRFLALAGYLWEEIWLASSMKTRAATSSAAIVSVNLRPSTNPQHPKISIGNVYEPALVRAENGAGIQELVTELYESVLKRKDIIAESKGTDRIVEVVFDRMQETWNVKSECKENFYWITSWCKCAGFDDVDFGFGKPKWVVPIDGLHSTERNLILLTEFADSDGDGFEAWLFLEEKTMQILESHKEFLSFCSPHF